MNKSRMINTITVVFVLLPLLSIYKSPIPTMELGTFLFLLLMPIALLYNKKNKLKYCRSKKNDRLLTYIVVYTSVSTLLSVFLQDDVNIKMIMMRLLKYVIVIMLAKYYINTGLFNIELGIKYLRIITLVSCIFLIVQTFFYYVVSIPVHGVIYSLVNQGDYYAVGFNEIKYLYRPTSFFLEPMSFCGYVVVYLVFLVANRQGLRNNKMELMVIVLSIILSTSGGGYVLLAVVTMLYFFANIKNKKTILLFMILLILSPLIMYALTNSDIIKKSVGRITNGEETGGSSLVARTDSINEYKKLPIFYKIIGMGYGNPIPNTYMSSLSYTLYCSGAIGTMLVLLYLLNYIRNKNRFVSMLGCIWLILIIGTTSFAAIPIAFHLPFLTEMEDSK